MPQETADRTRAIDSVLRVRPTLVVAAFEVMPTLEHQTGVREASPTAWAATTMAWDIHRGPYMTNWILVSSGMFCKIHSALSLAIPSEGRS